MELVPHISLLAVELATAFALALLWASDRERTYTLWWAIAHIMMALPALLSAPSRAEPPSTLLFAATCLVLAARPVFLLAGVVAYRQQQLALRHVGIALLALFLLIYLPTLVTDRSWVRGVIPLSMIVALVAAAAMIWPLGPFERLAAVCFLLRGAYEIALVVLIGIGQRDSLLFNHFSNFNALTATGTALALLIAAYQRSLDRLRQQYRILELAHELTGRLQGVGDERDLAQRVLTVLQQRLGWQEGMFLVLTPEPQVFLPIAAFGSEPSSRLHKKLRVPDTGLINTALRTTRVCHTSNLPADLRVADSQRNTPQVTGTLSQAVIPVLHNGEALGLIVLRDAQRRELQDAEILTLESLGQVIGLSLANTRNLRELTYRANHDALTGLGNRAALHEFIRDGLLHYADHRGAVMLFDLDHFKQINDALGHAVGDDLLRELAQRLQQHLANRPAQLFRLGGDEFVILHQLTAGSHDEALAIGRELAEVIAAPLQIGELSLRTAASIGIAIGLDHGSDSDSHELLRCADVAMYHAKQHGTGVTLYERAIDAHKLEHLTLLSAVNEGLEKNQFELFYQPFINLTSGAIEGCEGLIRWRHPTLGLIGAAEFMPLIEATDLIRAITRRVIDIAMSDAARWQQRGIDSRIAINLSARNILDPELPAYLLDSAARHRVEPRRIQLELTETILIKDPASAGVVMQRLTDAGFTLALDDFGTGYSSLAYLARFPIHTLKIDRSFVRDMLAHTQSRTIVESTIALARGLGLRVTAEGVEQEAEAELLRQLGCDYAQGYLFSRPVPEPQLTALWQRALAVGTNM